MNQVSEWIAEKSLKITELDRVHIFVLDMFSLLKFYLGYKMSLIKSIIKLNELYHAFKKSLILLKNCKSFTIKQKVILSEQFYIKHT